MPELNNRVVFHVAITSARPIPPLDGAMLVAVLQARLGALIGDPQCKIGIIFDAPGPEGYAKLK